MDNTDKPQLYDPIQKKVKNRWRIVLIGVIIGCLLCIALLIYLILNIDTCGVRDVSNLKLRKDSIELQIALEQYADRYGKLPTEEQGLFALVEKPTLPPIPKDYKPILNKKSAILDPWKTPYILKFLPNGDYAIITLGRDKKEGGEGKDSDFNILKEEEFPIDFSRGK